jgi:hypothetical protein
VGSDGTALDDWAAEDRAAQCNDVLGYKNGSRACTACREGFTRYGLSSCAQCMEPAVAKWLWVSAAFAAVVFVVVVVRWKVRAENSGKKSYHSEKRIIVSNLQVISVLMSFSVNWPQSLVSVMNTVGAPFSGTNLVSALDCTAWLNPLVIGGGDDAIGDRSYASIMYASILLISLIPFMTLLLSAIYWYACTAAFPRLLCKRQVAAHESNPRDGLMVTMVFVSYLMYPSLARSGLELFDCEYLGDPFSLAHNQLVNASGAGASTGTVPAGEKQFYLARDLDETCFVGRHWSMLLFVGFPMVALYLVGMPLTAMCVLYRNRAHLVVHHKRHAAQQQEFGMAGAGDGDEQQLARLQASHESRIEQIEKRNLFTWGMVYSGFREDRWWWEITIVVRKLGLIAIATFIKKSETQIATALGLMILLVNIEHLFLPYNKGSTLDGEFLHRLEIMSFGVLLLLLWQALFFTIVDCNAPSQAGQCETLTAVAMLSELVFLGYSVYHFFQNWCMMSKSAKKFRQLGTRFHNSSSTHHLPEIEMSVVPPAAASDRGGGSKKRREGEDEEEGAGSGTIAIMWNDNPRRRHEGNRHSAVAKFSI